MQYINEVVESRTDTASTNIALTQPWGQATAMRGALRVTAASGGTPSMTVVVQGSADGGNNWEAILTFTAATTTTSQRLNASLWEGTPVFIPNKLRVNVTITGTTPSFTWELHLHGKN